MADIVDIANEHDYSTERLQARRTLAPEVERGNCLFCTEPVTAEVEGKIVLYCDGECRKGFEHQQLIRSKQRRM